MKGDEGQGGSRPNPYRAVKAPASPKVPPKPPALAPPTPAVNRSSFHDLCLLPLDLPTTPFSPQHRTSFFLPPSQRSQQKGTPGDPRAGLLSHRPIPGLALWVPRPHPISAPGIPAVYTPPRTEHPAPGLTHSLCWGWGGARVGLRQPAAQETEGLGSTLPREASLQKVGAGK